MFDTLCHLPLFPSVADARAHLARAAADGVTEVLCAGTEPRRVERVPTASELPAGLVVHRAYGVHPQNAHAPALADQLAALRVRLGEAPRVVALGELGLDQRDGQPPLEEQEATLRAQLALARERGLPVILHLVRARARGLEIVEEEGPLPGGGVWHAFAGPKEAIERAQRLGLAFSVGGLVRNPRARRLHDALPHVPAELLLVETDAPHGTEHGDAAPTLHAVVDEVARRRGEDAGEVAKRTQANARRVFRVASTEAHPTR